jgi:hypothetical protein
VVPGITAWRDSLYVRTQSEILFKIYLDNLPSYNNGERDTVDLASGIIYSGQANRYDFHHYGYSFTTLKTLLESIGFRNIQTFNRES